MLDKDGYVLVLAPHHPHVDSHGYVREHRLIVEKRLGRFLDPSEVVDHVNGIHGDNRDENLRLFASNAEHLRATLKGVACPARANRYGPSPTGKGKDGQPLLGKTRQRRASRGKAARTP